MRLPVGRAGRGRSRQVPWLQHIEIAYEIQYGLASPNPINGVFGNAEIILYLMLVHRGRGLNPCRWSLKVLGSLGLRDGDSGVEIAECSTRRHPCLSKSNHGCDFTPTDLQFNIEQAKYQLPDLHCCCNYKGPRENVSNADSLEMHRN